jgi:hypothetical protein
MKEIRQIWVKFIGSQYAAKWNSWRSADNDGYLSAYVIIIIVIVYPALRPRLHSVQ